MYNNLEQIYQTKKKIISKRTKINTNLLIKAYDGIVKQKTITEIHRDIRRILIKNDCYDKYIENYVRKVVKKAKQTEDYDKLFNDMLIEGINAIVFSQARKMESNMKDEVIHNMVEKNRWDLKNKVFGEDEVIKAKIFYLASHHIDSAEDHRQWQGKIYVDKNWEMLLNKYPETKKKVKKFIEEQDIRDFQWVIGKPVYFITRPNCRHYFKPLTIEQALSFSPTTLLHRYNMTHSVGKQDMKPIKTSGSVTYTRSNIENIIKKYQERLDYHEGLYKVKQTDEMKRYVDKDKLLIKKWKEYLSGKRG